MKPDRRFQYHLGEMVRVVLVYGLLVALIRAPSWIDKAGRAGYAVAAIWLASMFAIACVAVACWPRAGGLAALFARRCPECGSRALLRVPAPKPGDPRELARCCACGASCKRLAPGPWEAVVPSPIGPDEWLVGYLPRLREARRRARPDVVPELVLPPTVRSPGDPRAPEVPREGGRRRSVLRTALDGLAVPTAIVGAASLAGVVTWISTEPQILALLGVSYMLYSCLIVGWLWRLSWPQVLSLAAASAAVMALQVALVGRALDWTSILVLAIALPATPIGLGLLIARSRQEEPATEVETTPGLLLRSQRRRNPRPWRKAKVPLAPPASPWDHLWDG